MNRFSTLASLLTSLTIVASCGQLIGLSDFEKGEEEAEGGQGASGGKGGAGGSTGGKGGASGGKGGASGGKGGASGGNGGTTGGRGGSNNEGGEGGAAAEAGVGGSNGGNAGNGGSSGAGAVGGVAGVGGMSGSGGTAGTAGTAGCIEITPGVAIAMEIRPPDPTFSSAVYDYAIDEQLGSSFDDVIGIQLYSDTGLDGQLTGTFTVGAGIDDNYSSCARCILIERDVTMIGNAGDTRFYASSGTLVIDAASEHMVGRPIITMDNVTLIEVTIDADTYLSTPVPDGECYYIEHFSFSLPTAGWMCDDSTWGDNLCTCGCGTRDLECTSPASDVCDDCTATGSCSTSCLDIAADNNATCGASVPTGWTCGSLAYGDGVCNCGCGVIDPDCVADASWACDLSGACVSGSCGDYDCIGVDLAQNWLCSNTGWTCNAAYYDALDGCDCGCGLVDPDCASPTGVCDYCSNAGACSVDCADIDPTDNSQCL